MHTRPTKDMTPCHSFDSLEFIVAMTSLRKVLQFKIQTYKVRSWHIKYLNKVHTYNINFVIGHHYNRNQHAEYNSPPCTSKECKIRGMTMNKCNMQTGATETKFKSIEAS
jgi:hypothetical protein